VSIRGLLHFLLAQ